MKYFGNRFKKLTLAKVAAYIFLIALGAKGVALVASHHPLKEEMISITGIVKKIASAERTDPPDFKSNPVTAYTNALLITVKFGRVCSVLKPVTR